MNILLVLYLIYLSWGTAGQGRVSILEMSRYLRLSKSAARNILLKMAQDGWVEIIRTYSDKGSEKLLVQLSDRGQDYMMQNFDSAISTYHKHVAETVLIMKERYAGRDVAPRKLSKKEILAIQAGQKGMFNDN